MENEASHEFVIIRKSYTFATCPACDGHGVKTRTFRKMTFVVDCPDCNGEGFKRVPKTEEFPLLEALKEINQINSTL